MKHVLCVHLKNWPIDRLRRRLKHLPHEPLVLTRTIASRQIIVAASEQARTCNIFPGMTLIEARALYAKVIHTEHDPARDAQGLEALGRYMQRFTPIVAFAPEPRGADWRAVQEATEHGLFLDLTGCERLFGGFQKLINLTRLSLQRLHISASVALAPTPGAAWALASSNVARVFNPCEDPSNDENPCTSNLKFQISNFKSGSAGASPSQDLAPLPPAALRIDAATAAALHHLGIETIGQLLDLPRKTLPSRFGPALLMRLDQAMGKIAEPLVSLPQHSRIESAINFESAIDSLEILWLALRHLLQHVVTELTRRGCGARTLDLRFERTDAPPVDKRITLARPTRQIKRMFELLRCALEQVETDEGFVGVRLGVPSFERISDEQAFLHAPDDLIHHRELDHLIERLQTRLGPEAITQAELIESHIPELACAWRSERDAKKTPARNDNPHHVWRPLTLLDEPREIRVTVAPSHDRDGRPVQFNRGRHLHAIVHALGPQRISGQWWRNRFKTRDYFDVEDSDGRRFWIFRVCETGKWYLHGTNG